MGLKNVEVDLIMEARKKYILISVLCFIVMWAVMLTSMPYLSLAFFALSLLFAYGAQTEHKLEKEKMRNNFIKQLDAELEAKGITKSQFYLDENAETGIVIDEKNQKFTIINKQSLITLPYSSLVEVEWVEDEVSVLKANKASVIGRSIVGGAILGGVGSIIGAATSTKTSSKEVKKIDLRLIVDDLSNPNHNINFLKLNKPIKTIDSIYQQSSHEAFRWHKMLEIILKRQAKYS